MVNISEKLPDPIETEQLLKQINEQLTQKTFDPKDSELLQKMVEALADKRGMIRLGFVEAFGKIGKPITPFLLKALANHPNPVVRRSAGKGLAQIQEPSSIPTLINALLNDEDTVVKSSSAGALAKMGALAVKPLLEIIKGDYPGTCKGQASWALGFIGSEGIEELLLAYQSDHRDVRVSVVGALGRIAESRWDNSLEQILFSALEDRDIEVRLEAIATLSKIPPALALAKLIPLLEESNLELSKAAFLALGKLGEKEALPYLEAKLEDNRPGISQVAKIAISQIK
ncbi:PBS lyase HEAT-like repeat [Trichodesmium erythraeum IMS101]|uniref:PBS lyase HEAT-like repeat n=1 Tax=Trichodesmium erythraeum (strain IMS101) TaxID=203124 RepID=Q117F7_TRIEI|nr:HEAT repeat domain-containing protein [Trichodesmium erythraeum GBRTRLIN201]MDE5092853.1 HEAT repeat domain-containing protein [Trichodesmium sp. St11_bin5]